jgi:hypothetical protein
MYTLAGPRLVRRGPLTQYLSEDVKLGPNRTGDKGDVEYHQTSRKGFKAAADFLKNALRSLGIVNAPKLDLSFADKSDLDFSLSGVSYKATDPSLLDQALTHKLRTGAIPDDDVRRGKLHVVYEYLYARSVLMRRADHQSFGLTARGINVEQFLDLGAKAQLEIKDETTIRFKSSGLPAVVGYKSGRLTRSKGQWEFHLGQEPGHGFAQAQTENRVVEPFIPAPGVVLLAYET